MKPRETRPEDSFHVASERNSPLAGALAASLREAADDIARRWLERILARVNVDPDRVFPSRDLLDHVPLLVSAIADHLGDPVEEVTATGPVVAKALELGELRYRQGFSAHEILKEFEILGGIILKFLTEEVRKLAHTLAADDAAGLADAFLCAHRVHRALAGIQQVATTQFLQLMEIRVNERERRLRSFNRMVSHELKGWVHGALGASRGLLEGAGEGGREERLHEIISENLEALSARLDDLLRVTWTDPDSRQQQHVGLPGAVGEVIRRLEKAAEAKGVELRVGGELPDLEVNAAIVELCLTNYLSNAIKYSDPRKEERWAEVRGAVRRAPTDEDELVVEVRDNGLGVPEELRPRLFSPFFRAHAEASEADGSGLGLSIVREAVEALGGRVWADFPSDGGAVFAFALPSRSGEAGTGANPGEGGPTPSLDP
jgi:signal transduction histidine kinase